MFRSSRFASLVAMFVCAAFLVAGCGPSSSAKLVSIGAGLSGPKELRATVYATGLKNAAAFAFDSEGRPGSLPPTTPTRERTPCSSSRSGAPRR